MICGTCYFDFPPNHTRPYGEGGSNICYDCMKRPGAAAVATRVFDVLIRAAEAASPVGVAVIGSDTGPAPLVPSC